MSRHVLFENGIRRLGSKESGFFYRYPDSGETVRDRKTLERIESLKIPPAYEDVHVAHSARAKVQAVGYDTSGKVQYTYSPAYRSRKEREKFERVLRFADALPEMRKVTSGHLRRKNLDRDKVLAAMTRLMNAAYFRVGSERYAKANRTYGIATLRQKHLSIEGDTMTFEYTGKWGQERRHVVTDRVLREVVEECVDLPGYEVFKYVEDGSVKDVKARDLNVYIKEVIGEEFTPKDFRTWAGTLIAAVRLAEIGVEEDEGIANKNVLEAIDEVAGRLGNTREIARASYVSPRLIDHYLEGSIIAGQADSLVLIAEQNGLTDGEKALLDLLKKKLRRELARSKAA